MASRLKEEDLRLNIIVNGDKGRKEILDLETAVKGAEQSLKKLRAEAKAMETAGKTGTEEYKRTTEAIRSQSDALSQNRERLSFLRRQLDVNKMTLSELQKNINATSAALRRAVPGTENWKRLGADLQTLNTRYRELRQQSVATDKTLCDIAGRMRDYVVSVAGMISSARSIYSTVSQATGAFTEYDEALTDAMKTTNLSKKEITELSEALAGIDTRTSQNDLLALARAGGKLGIEGRDNLLGFVRAADQINVALSEDLGGDAEAAITAVGKMTDIFRLQDMYGVEQAMLKVGSAINELGMASTANEGYMVDFTQRMAGIAPNADISIDKILGLAATLDKYGQTAEMSSTALGQMIQMMFRDTETFAEIAGMSLKEFSDILNNDVNEAMLRVLEGMRKSGETGLAPIVKAMDAMGLNGQRASQVLGTLADHVDELRSQQVLANEAFERGTSLTEEFSVKNTSATAVLEKQQKAIQAQVVAIGQDLMPLVNGVMSVTEVGMKTLAGLVKLLAENRTVLLALSAVYSVYVARKKLAVLTSREHRSALAAELLSLRNARAGTIALAVVQNTLAGSFRAARIALNMLKTALISNPITAIITGIAVAAGALYDAFRRSEEKTKEVVGALDELNEKTSDTISNYTEAKTKIDNERDALERLKTAALGAAEGSDARAEAIRAINDQFGDYLPALLTEKSSNEDIEMALRGVNDELERKIMLQARESAESEILQHKTDAVKAAVEGLNKLYEQKTGEELGAGAIRDATEALMEYYDALLEDPTANGKDPGVEFVNTMRALGIVTDGANGRFVKLSKAFEEATGKGRQLRAVTDGLYGARSAPVKPGNADFIGPVLPEAAAKSGNSGETTAPTSAVATVATVGGGSAAKWSLSSDSAYQEALLKMKRDYLDGAYEDEKSYNEAVMELEIRTLEERLATNKESGDDRLKLEQQLADKRIQLKKSQTKEEEKVEQEAYDADVKRSEQQWQIERTELMNRHALEVQAFSGSAQELQELKKRQAEELAEVDMRHVSELQGMLEELLGMDDELGLPDKILSDEEYLALMKKLQSLVEKYNELAGKGDGSGSEGDSGQDSGGDGFKTLGEGTGKGSLFGVSQKSWKSLFDNIKEGKFGAQDLSTVLSGIGGAAQEGFKLASKWSQMMAAQEQAQLKEYEKANEKKKSALEDRLNAGLMTEAQYNAEVEKMDAEYEAYQEELQLKQAKRNKQMQLTQAIINTALGVTTTLAQWGVPWGLIPAGIMAAMGAAETAMIASTPITTGAEEGGPQFVEREQDGRRFKARLDPDRRGFIGSPTVLVGENGEEYVVPHEGVENPTLAPILHSIEAARRNGTLRSLDFSAVYPVVRAVGMESGGPAIGNRVPSRKSVHEPSGSPGTGGGGDSGRLADVLEKLNSLLSSPIRAEVSMLGKNGLIEQQKKYETYRKRGSINGQ